MEFEQKRKVILDMDPGIDDALALLLALCSSELKVLAVTTVAGNAPIEMTSINALRVLEYLGVKDVPVARGADRPLVRPLVHALRFYGSDGLADCALPLSSLKLHEASAVELLADTILNSVGEITIIAMGPLTNLATALEQRPELPRAIASLIIMGGAYGLTAYGKGNQTPVAEFNIWQDPEAARVVFNSGVDIIAVGLDVTADPRACMGHRHLKQLWAGQTPAARLAARFVEYCLVRYGRCELHDPLALAALLDVSLFQLVSAPVVVVTEDGSDRGRTRILSPEEAEGQPWMRVAVGIDGPRFLQLFVSRLLEV